MAPPIFCKTNPNYKWFTRGDVDSFLMLFFDNMSSLIAILGTMAIVLPNLMLPFGVTEFCSKCGLDPAPIGQDYKDKFAEVIWLQVCPGIAFALAFGNLWYAWMAAKLSGHTGQLEVTALPYGINTPAGFIACWNVMLPIGGATLAIHSDSMTPDEWATKTWQTACAVNFIGGLFEIAGSVWDIRPYFSMAALYSPVAAVGFVWLALVPLTEVAKEPIIGILPFCLAFTAFFAGEGKGVYSKKMAGCGAALICFIGTALKWAGAGKYTGDQEFMWDELTRATDAFAGKNQLMQSFPLGYWDDVKDFVAVIFPVALQSFVETMENVEAASAMGDDYNLREAMIVDGVGTCIGAFFGSVIPTTVYIGHKRHKVIGAHAGYSVVNALVYFIILNTGLFPMFYFFLDATSIGVILLIVGLLIGQQAVEVSATRHMPALFIGLMCLICDWATLNANANAIGIQNIAAGGGIMASLLIPQIVCDFMDNRYGRCAVFCAVATVFCLFGIMHGMNPVDVDEHKPSGFPFFGTGTMKVKGQLTVSIKDELPGIGPPMVPDPSGCGMPPEFRANQITAAGAPSDGMNEGWRFSIAYAMACLFALMHKGLQLMGCLAAPVMDNGKNPHYVVGGVTSTEEEGAKYKVDEPSAQP